MSAEPISSSQAPPPPSLAPNALAARFLALVRPEERWPTLLATLTILLVMSAHACVETARDALFLAHAPTTNLPWVYLVLAVLAILVSHLIENIGGRETVWRGMVATQIFAGFGTLVFVARVPVATYWTFHALYVWGGLAATVVVVRFWMLLSERMTTSQAKRLFPLIAAGPVAGTLVGFAIAGFVGERFGGYGLLLTSTVMFFGSAAMGLTLRNAFCYHPEPEEKLPVVRATPSHRAIEQARKIRGTSGFRIILKNRYVRYMTLVMLAASVTATLGDYVFKSVVNHEVPVRELSSFFATTYFVFNLLSVVVLFVVTPFIRWIGVTRALAVEPILLIVVGAVWAVFGGMPAVLYLRGVDGALRWSLQKTATELLYVPMSGRLRTTVKALSDVLGHRGGQAIASVLILVLLALGAQEIWIGAIIVAGALVWIRAATSLRQPYLELFRRTLRTEFAETRLDFPDLDLASLEALIAALNSGDDAEVIGAMELLDEAGRAHLIPALILYHPSSAVVIRALDLFQRSGREDFVAITRRVLSNGNPAVCAAIVRATASARPNRADLERARQSDSAPIAVTAIVALAVNGWLDPNAAMAELTRRLEENSQVGLFIALAAGARPMPALSPLLIRLARSPEAETRREAVRALGRAGDAAAIPALIEALGDREVREEARETLIALGDPAFEALRGALADAALADDVRVHVPRTIARFNDQRAADLLLDHFAIEPRGRVRYKILRGLGRMVSDEPELQLDTAKLDQAIDRYITHLFDFLHWSLVLEQGAVENPARRTTGHELMLDLIRAKYTLALERLFRLIGLRYRGENISRIYRGIVSEDPDLRSSSRELLESVLPVGIRAPVMILTDDLPVAARLAVATATYRPEEITYEELVLRLASQAGQSLAYLAAYHAAELGLPGSAALAPLAARGFAKEWGRSSRTRQRGVAILEPALTRGAA